MELKKKGFIFKIAYFFIKEEHVPQQTSLCKLFWRFLLMLFLGIPLGCTAIAVLVVVLYTVGFLFAARPSFFKGDCGDAPLCCYRRWPTIKGRKVFPIIPAFFVLAIINYASLVKGTVAAGKEVAKYTIFCWPFWNIVAAILVLFLIALFKVQLKESETFQLFKEFIKAKKEKICPIVKIVE